MKRRTVVILLLLAAILACIAMLPWGRWLQGPPPDARKLLDERVARYVALRKQDDWQTLYSLTDERDRKKIARPLFLTYFGQGLLKVQGVTEQSREIDVGKGVAVIKFEVEGELDYDSLPARIRSGMRGRPDAAALKRTAPLETEWSWNEGTWWLRMDRELVTGVTKDGKTIQLEPPPDKAGPEKAGADKASNGDQPKK